jgi:hypothetical protein
MNEKKNILQSHNFYYISHNKVECYKADKWIKKIEIWLLLLIFSSDYKHSF